MSKVYYLKMCDDVVGTISYPEFKFIKDASYNKDLPRWLFRGKHNPSRKDVIGFLVQHLYEIGDRSWDIERREKIPLDNLWSIYEATLGMSTLDNIWLVPKEKLHWRYKTHHIRCNPKLWMNYMDKDWVIHGPKIKDAREINDIPEEWLEGVGSNDN